MESVKQPRCKSSDTGSLDRGSIEIGRYVGSPGMNPEGIRFLCDAPELERHIEKPWFRSYAAERLDLPLPLPGTLGAEPPSSIARVGVDLLARHTCVIGATGSGKTRLALHLLAEQLRAGCSAVILDPKIETLRHLLSLACNLGMAPEQVTVLSPHLSGAGAPGWNPLDAKASGVTPAQAAADVVSVLENSTSSWGPRMGDILTNALIIVASHGLSLYELARLLQRDDYRDTLMRTPLLEEPAASGLTLGSIAFEEAQDFFLSEFAAWGKSERASAVAPVLNKFRELLRTPFLRSLLCARRTTLHLGSLWHRPGLVLVHLDSAALGDEGVRLLGGLLAHQLLRTAMRSEGPVPVVLALDEMGVSEEFVGGAAAKILAIARSRGLRLLVACQHLEQLSEGLRTSLLANTSVRAFFRLGYTDAKLVAASLAAGTGERTSKVVADVAKRDTEGLPEAWAESTHTVRDGRGEPICLSPAAVQAFWHLARKAEGEAQIVGLKRLASVSGIDRLYVHAADSKKPVELSRYVRGLSPRDYGLSGSGPVRLIVSFPRPRLSVLSRETEAERERRWIKTLGELPVRHAVLRLASGEARTVQVLPVADSVPAAGFERFLSAAVAASGQSAREVEQVQTWRRETAEQVAEDIITQKSSQPDRFAPGHPSVSTKAGAFSRSPRNTASQSRSAGTQFGSPLQSGTSLQSMTNPPAASGAHSPVQKGVEAHLQPVQPSKQASRLPEKNIQENGMPVKEESIMEISAIETIAEDGSLA